MDPKIKEYLENQDPTNKKIILKIREIFFETLSNPKEEAKWGVIAYRGGKFYLANMKTRVHVGFAINGLSEEDIKHFEGTGKTMRHIKVQLVEDIDVKKLKKLIGLVEKKTKCE